MSTWRALSILSAAEEGEEQTKPHGHDESMAKAVQMELKSFSDDENVLLDLTVDTYMVSPNS